MAQLYLKKNLAIEMIERKFALAEAKSTKNSYKHEIMRRMY